MWKKNVSKTLLLPGNKVNLLLQQMLRACTNEEKLKKKKCLADTKEILEKGKRVLRCLTLLSLDKTRTRLFYVKKIHTAHKLATGT